MKTVDGSSRVRFLSWMIISLLILISGYAFYNYFAYKSIEVVVDKAATIEYGSANYDIKKMLKEVSGEIVSIKSEIDTKVIGEQEVIVEVKKANVIKEVPIVISVVDTVAPIIKVEEDTVKITEGEDYDLTTNILSVIDEVEGDIPYSKENLGVGEDYYNFSYTDDLASVGSHTITVNAYDKYGNVSIRTFTLEVEERHVEAKFTEPVFTNLAANGFSNDLVSIAYSLIGSPYISGGTGPSGFDCSGFVQYVYRRVGINISRSASTQLYDGVAVSYQEAKPGDILSWGYGPGVVTHSALYIGDGKMIHATNPRQGVILSDVEAWTRGSGTHVISVRRI